MTIFILLPGAAAAGLSIQNILQPFAWLDPSHLYDAHSGLIDFFIYVLIFVGATQATLGKKFPDSGGRALSIGAGLTLAIGMLLAEDALGFNIKSFGPIAAAILILLLGIVIYRMLHFAGLNRIGSVSAAYITILLASFAIIPDWFHTLNRQYPAFALVLIIALFLAFIGLASSFWPTHARFMNYQLRRAASQRPNVSNKPIFHKETKFIKKRIKPITKRAVKDSIAILKDLIRIKKATYRYGDIPQAKTIIISQLHKILPRQHQLRIRIQELRTLTQNIMDLDQKLYTKQQRQWITNLKPKQKQALREELKTQIEKLRVGKKLNQIEAILNQNTDDIERHIYKVEKHLRDDQIQESIQTIEQAIGLEQNNTKLAKATKNLEKLLIDLTRRQNKIDNLVSPQ